LITNKKIDNFIDKIPPAPKALQATIMFLNSGELIKAAQIAKTDLALKSYLENIVNKPIYGFKNQVSDISQIFGILGVAGSQQATYNYMLSLLSPEKWVLFELNSTTFHELQARLSTRYNIILNHLNIKDKDMQSAISLLPASIIVAEALLNESIDDVILLRTTKSLDYNTILKRLCKIDLFDISQLIAKKWEMPNKISQIIQVSSGIKPSTDKDINTLGKWIHLLLFYELSQPIFIKAGLNDFIDFQVDFVNDIYEDFMKIMEVESK